MSNAIKGQVIGRAWTTQGEHRLHLGDQHRLEDGTVVMVWRVPPESHRGVIWLENLKAVSEDVSAS